MTSSTNVTPEQPAEQGETNFADVAKPLHKDLQAALDGIPRQIENIKAMQPMVLLADDLEARFPSYLHRDISINTYMVTVSFQLKSMSEAKDILKHIMRVHGLRQSAKVWIYEGDKSLNWKFPGLMITGHFRGYEKSQCRFVQTGTKVVPVYAMQCDDGDAPDSADDFRADEEEGRRDAALAAEEDAIARDQEEP